MQSIFKNIACDRKKCVKHFTVRIDNIYRHFTDIFSPATEMKKKKVSKSVEIICTLPVKKTCADPQHAHHRQFAYRA
jgi:hypothetical protein